MTRGKKCWWLLEKFKENPEFIIDAFETYDAEPDDNV